jgi:hypothetical protein
MYETKGDGDVVYEFHVILSGTWIRDIRVHAATAAIAIAKAARLVELPEQLNFSTPHLVEGNRRSAAFENVIEQTPVAAELRD